MDQVLEPQEFFVMWWARYTWWLGGGLTAEIPDISKHQAKLLPTILKVTEDDGPSFGLPIIFCHVVCLLLLIYPYILCEDIMKLVQDHVFT
jgi:hypothetical protein